MSDYFKSEMCTHSRVNKTGHSLPYPMPFIATVHSIPNIPGSPEWQDQCQTLPQIHLGMSVVDTFSQDLNPNRFSRVLHSCTPLFHLVYLALACQDEKEEP